MTFQHTVYHDDTRATVRCTTSSYEELISRIEETLSFDRNQPFSLQLYNEDSQQWEELQRGHSVHANSTFAVSLGMHDCQHILMEDLS